MSFVPSTLVKFSLLAFLLNASLLFAVPQKAAILTAEGNTQIFQENKRIIKAKPLTMLGFGDIILNASNARLLFRWKDGIKVSANENALFALSSLGPSIKSQRVLLLGRGAFSVRTELTKNEAQNNETLCIKTFTCAINIADKTSNFTVFCAQDGTSLIFVDEGSIVVKIANDIKLNPGEKLLIKNPEDYILIQAEENVEPLLGSAYSSFTSWNRELKENTKTKEKSQMLADWQNESEKNIQKLMNEYQEKNQIYVDTIKEYQQHFSEACNKIFLSEIVYPAQDERTKLITQIVTLQRQQKLLEMLNDDL